MATTRYKTVFLRGRPVPKLCECGSYQRVGGKEPYNVASFFFDHVHGEFTCCGCGKVLNKYGE